MACRACRSARRGLRLYAHVPGFLAWESLLDSIHMGEMAAEANESRVVAFMVFGRNGVLLKAGHLHAFGQNATA